MRMIENQEKTRGVPKMIEMRLKSMVKIKPKSRREKINLEGITTFSCNFQIHGSNLVPWKYSAPTPNSTPPLPLL